ncbi:unnamed protein product [Thlaspi arvense]|uniref:RRM domain-containing protein n=1 Tax=Thlaspi arvense TaxID=13288 RepID=A0AAU9SRD1_THLAR|nr:unnamed protein product [Thlaspi arvense]
MRFWYRFVKSIARKQIFIKRQLRVNTFSRIRHGKHSSERFPVKGKEFKLFESEAAMEAFMKETSKPRVRISVEGYDTSLPGEDIKKALANHFASCGEVFNVKFSEGRVGRVLLLFFAEMGQRRRRCNLMEVTWEDGLVVLSYTDRRRGDSTLSSRSWQRDTRGHKMHSRSKADIYFSREDEEEKVLTLDGTEVGGRELAVTRVATARSNTPLGPLEFRRVGYCVPAHCIEMARQNEEKVIAFKMERGLM